MASNPSTSPTVTNGILIDAGLVDLLYKNKPTNPNSLLTWNKTEAVTAVLQWYTRTHQPKGVAPTQIPYYKGTGTDTFAYRHVAARKYLEEAGSIVNLGWYINEAIAVYLGIAHTPVFARVANVSEWSQVLALDTKTCRIATNPADNRGDDSVFQST